MEDQNLTFEWDFHKNDANVAKHGIDFTDVVTVFRGPMLITLDSREDYGEDRWAGLGPMSVTTVKVIYTEPAANVIRLISARKAQSNEQKQFAKYLQDGLGAA